jgi:hypothetical protein
MELQRKEVIQSLIDNRGFRRYLEIGVYVGRNFFQIRAKDKVAVDPAFYYSWFKRIKKSFSKSNFTNASSKSYKLKSDEFFTSVAPAMYKAKDLDICLVDGMHEYDYALRDVENALQYLQKNGVIVMHDCNPQTAEAAVSFQDWKKRDYYGFWNGDVWKSILHLRSTRNDINVFVLDTDHGLGVVTFGQQEKQLSFTPEQIRGLSYADLEKNRKEWLNLKDPSYFYDYFKVPRG